MRILNMLDGERTVRISHLTTGAIVTAKINDVATPLNGAPVTVPASGEVEIEFIGAALAAGNHVEVTATPTATMPGSADVSRFGVLAKPAPVTPPAAPVAPATPTVTPPPAGPILPPPPPPAQPIFHWSTAAVLVAVILGFTWLGVRYIDAHATVAAARAAIPAVSATATPAPNPAADLAEKATALAAAFKAHDDKTSADAATVNTAVNALVKALTPNPICGKRGCDTTAGHTH